MKNNETFTARLRYDPQIDDYTGTLASIQPLDMDRWEEGKF
jgi:hypothetical protein